MVGRHVVSLAVVALLLGNAATTLAAPKLKAKPAAVAAKPKKGKAAEKEKEKEKEQESEKEKERDKDAKDANDAEPGAEDAKASTKEEAVKSAGTATPKSTDTSAVQVKEDKEGVKTYKFETVEVEGRLKSPQVIYFLRRVRAEFEAGLLGHRSFLGELSDSRRSAAFR
jgi:hypothetical protein